MTVPAANKRNRVRETGKDRVFNAINLIFWILVLFIVLYPLWLILIASVSDPDAVLQAKVLLWPVDFSLMGYEAVFQYKELWGSYLNSIFYTVVGSGLSVVVTLAAAYALSRRFAGKKLVNLAITFTMFFSGGLIPIFLNIRDLGLYNTRAVMILMNLVSVWNLMVARTYIQTSIPNDLYEAAVIDGADHFTYFFRCVLPLSGTIVAVLSVYDGVARWNGEEVSIPTYNFVTGLREYNNRLMKLDKDSVLLVEGIHALNPQLTDQVPEDSKFRIFINTITSLSLDDHNFIPTSDIRLLRRIVRDYNKGAFSARETIAQWPNVRGSESLWIYPYQEVADVLFNSSYLIELAVLRNNAQIILGTVPKNCPEYSEAHRLLKFLSYFIPVPDKEIPPTSLMREYVGGSSFKY